jgi:sulfate transport system substrate-binding protein
VDYKGTRAAAEAYLEFLYTDGAQEIFARHYYRPASEAILKRNADRFPAIDLVPISRLASDWEEAQQKFFAEGAIIDQVMH